MRLCLFEKGSRIITSNIIDKEYTVEKFLNLISGEMAEAFGKAGYDRELGGKLINEKCRSKRIFDMLT